jgi:hypothetical protein
MKTAALHIRGRWYRAHRGLNGANVNQDFIDEAFRVATRMASDRGIQIDQAALTIALIAVTGERDGQANK